MRWRSSAFIQMAKSEGSRSEMGRIIDSFPTNPDPSDFSSPEFHDVFLRLAAERHLEIVRMRSAKKLESVLEWHYAARGGLDALLELDDLIARGRLISAGRESPFVMIRKRPSYYRLDVATPQGVRIQATDGQVAWQMDPAVKDGTVLELPVDAAERLNRQAVFDDVLIRYMVTGERLVVRESARVDGNDAYRIDVDIPDHDRMAIFLDASSYLEVKRLIWTDPEAPPVTITFEHQRVNGVTLPLRQTIQTPTVVLEYRFDQYEIGQPVDRELFDPVSGHRVSLLQPATPATQVRRPAD